MRKKKLIINCGGTGGHIFPAIEIAKSLIKKDPSLDIFFVGALGRMEMDKVPKSGFSIKGIWIQGIYRKSILKNILFPLKLIISLIHAFLILLYHRPFAVIGTGGFASFPILYVASFLRIKTYIQEQNCYAGLTNRLLANRVNRVFVAHDGMHKFFPENRIMNFGNPVRKDLQLDLASKNKSRKFFGLKEDVFTILAVGGSLGAECINGQIAELLRFPDLVSRPFQVIWQTGLDFSNVDMNNLSGFENADKYNMHSIDDMCYLIISNRDSLSSQTIFSAHRFIDRMDLAYNAADIVISRAGAIAIAEICFLSKPSILIPSPHVTADHQTLNADYLKKHHAAVVLPEKDIWNHDRRSNKIQARIIAPCRKLFEHIDALMKDKKKRDKISNNANRLFQYDAADEIASIVLKDFNNT